MPVPDPPDETDPEPWTRKAPGRAVSQAELLVRIDERTNVLLSEIRTIKATTVTRAEFGPVKAVVYGMVALIMTTVIIALVSLVLTSR